MSWGPCLVPGYLCNRSVWVLPWNPWLLLPWGYVGVASWLCCGRLCDGHAVVAAIAVASARREAVLQLPRQPGEKKCCLYFLWLLKSPSSFLAHALPPLGSANSAKSMALWAGSATELGIKPHGTETRKETEWVGLVKLIHWHPCPSVHILDVSSSVFPLNYVRVYAA